jgi:LacI family transcriptional regulator
MVRSGQRIRHVALLVEWSRVYGRGVLRGIGQYVQAHGRWKVYHTERRLSDTAPAWLRKWRGDGIIARIENPRLAAQIKRMRLPCVDLFEHPRTSRVPAVLTDNRAIARLAAEHLIERGLHHFAYCGLPGIYSSDERCRHFVAHLAAAGHQVHVYTPPRRRRTPLIAASEDYELQREDAMVRWLRALPKPVGLMACNDLRAHQILMVCDQNQLAVPEELAVIGVDNDEVICGLSRPPLSSIEQNPEEVGYQAAALLDRLMQGDAPKRSRHTPCADQVIVEPRGVVARQSTDVVAVPDADLAVALHYIRQHACDGLLVADLPARTAMSRRTLERRFASRLGHSPKDEIDRVQLGHVKRLLAMTDYPLAKVAQLTGFRYVESMCALFKRTTAQTPGQYRREVRS